jgi:hypothetical protein
MKLIKKNLGAFVTLTVLGIVIGTLAWELLERIFAQAGLPFSLEAGPVGFDAGVLSLYIKVNPGSFIGAAAGILIFRAA